MDSEQVSFDPYKISRPHKSLWNYYLLTSAMSGPGFFFAVLPLYFRFKTLQYKFDEKGITMRWGILFKHEISLTYQRIQDIHLTSNIVQRWFGLATIEIQTASASSGAEMKIEGIIEAEKLRDFLYGKMRSHEQPKPPVESASEMPQDDEALALLHEIRDLMKARFAKERKNA